MLCGISATNFKPIILLSQHRYVLIHSLISTLFLLILLKLFLLLIYPLIHKKVDCMWITFFTFKRLGWKW